MAGLKAAAKQPTNLAKVYDARQRDNENPAEFLERVMNAFFLLYTLRS
jgi:tRNA A37 threonylcarbamoyladenosine synthetase subunit TsaC/SUA5/YrdC